MLEWSIRFFVELDTAIDHIPQTVITSQIRPRLAWQFRNSDFERNDPVYPSKLAIAADGRVLYFDSDIVVH